MPEADPTAHWKKWILAVLVLLAVLAGASTVVYGLLGAGTIPPLALLALAALISIGFPMLRSHFFPSRRDWETEFAFHEQRLASEVAQTIGESLGQEALNQILAAPDQYREAAHQAIEALLAQERAHQSADLRFALWVALGRFYAGAGQPEAALPAYQAAVAVKPQHFMARMHLAGLCEWLGMREDARGHYASLLEAHRDLSPAMKKLVAAKHAAILSA